MLVSVSCKLKEESVTTKVLGVHAKVRYYVNCGKKIGSYPLKLIAQLLTFLFGTGLSLYYGENLQTQEIYNTYKTKAKASYLY